LAKISTPTPIHRPDRRPTRKTDVVVQPREIPRERPKEAEPQPDPPKEEAEAPHGEVGGVTGGVVGGVPGGIAGGTVGGVSGGQVGGQLGGSVLPFGEGMTRPELISGEAPHYTPEALAARVEGTMIAKCVITIEGKLESCRIVKSLPYMERAVLDALSTRRYNPVHYQGRPVAVEYVIPIRLVIPR
jgi:protein TonB